MNSQRFSWIIATFLFFPVSVQAALVSFSFSTQLEHNGIGIPEGTVVYGAVTYESDQVPYTSTYYGNSYELTSLWLNIGGEETIAYGGRIFLDISSPYMTINTFSDGVYNNFSNQVLGADVLYGALSFELPSVLSDLPEMPEYFYDLSGYFEMNRTFGQFFDIDSAENLKIPGGSAAVSVPEPKGIALILIGVLGFLLTRLYRREVEDLRFDRYGVIR